MDYIANVENSEIDVSGIRTVLVQGDSSYPIIRFVLDPSLTGLSWRVRGTYTDTNIPVLSPEITPTETASAVTLDWSVSSDFTTYDGDMQLVLVGANDTGTTVVKALAEITIQKDWSIGTTATITLNLFEQLMAQANAAISKYPIITNGDWYVWNVTAGEYQDTGVAASSQWKSGTGITGTSTTPTAFAGSGIAMSNVGDMYLNASTSNTYRCTESGAAAVALWVYVSNIKGATGATGAGVATGGTANQLLYKTDGTDYNTGWKTLVPSDIGAADQTTISMLNNGGVFSGGAVTAQGTPNQTVAVSAGSVLTPEGKRYPFDAVSSLAASAADGTNPRIDIVYVSSVGVVTYLAGTAALSPAHPATPANGTLLAYVARAAGDNTIAAADIIDERAYTLWTKGKTINVFGDSQSDTGVKANAWPSLLPARLGVTVNNYAVSGKQIGGATGYAATMATYTSAADINLVMCGINDYWGNRVIGKSSSTDTAEFYGAVNVMFKYISEHWPRALNCVLLGPRVESYYTGTYGTDRLYQYIEYKVAKKYGFLVIDLYSALPNYNPAIAALKALYCTDGMHADAVYQPTIADIVANYIANKRCDAFPPSIFNVSNGCTIVASGGSSVANAWLDTNDIVHFRYTGTALPAANIVSYHVNLVTIPSFLYTDITTLMHIAGSLTLSAIYGMLPYNNGSVGFDYYSSTSDPFNISVCASWKAGYI